MKNWAEYGRQLLTSGQVPVSERAAFESKLRGVEASIQARGGDVLLRPSFTNEEKRALTSDGARIYLPNGKSINTQKAEKRPLDLYVTYPRALALASRKVEVAIYPYPDRFFEDDTFDKSSDEQWRLVVAGGQRLGRRLGLEEIGQIIPELPESTEVIFKHFDQSRGERLLGEKFKYLYMRTNTPTNESGSGVALAGRFDACDGLDVVGWSRDDGHRYLGGARWVVPMGTR